MDSGRIFLPIILLLIIPKDAYVKWPLTYSYHCTIYETQGTFFGVVSLVSAYSIIPGVDYNVADLHSNYVSDNVAYIM